MKEVGSRLGRTVRIWSGTGRWDAANFYAAGTHHGEGEFRYTMAHEIGHHLDLQDEYDTRIKETCEPLSIFEHYYEDSIMGCAAKLEPGSYGPFAHAYHYGWIANRVKRKYGLDWAGCTSIPGRRRCWYHGYPLTAAAQR